jgi:hypothetical protein
MKETSQINKILGFLSQIESFFGPHLARGPHVVDACLRPNVFEEKCRFVLSDICSREMDRK